MKHAGQKSVKEELPEQRKGPKRAVECRLKVQTHVWEDTPGQSHNFISGCCAVGSAPALGAGGPGFESPHSDQILQKNRLKRRFFCILSLIFVVLEIAVLRRFQWWNSGRGMSERSRRNRQIPNPSLTGKLPHFLRFYRCRCRPLLIACLRCVGCEAGFLWL